MSKVEDKLVGILKEQGLDILADNEEMLHELAAKAIHEAIFQPLRSDTGYGSYQNRDAPVVQAAREIATRAVAEIVAKEAKRLAEDEEFSKHVREALALSVPSVLRAQSEAMVDDIRVRAQQDTIELLRRLARGEEHVESAVPRLEQ